MFKRIRRLSKLKEFNGMVERMSLVDKKELELEYERLAGMECDIAAKLQTKDEFVETMRQAYESMVKKKAMRERRFPQKNERVPGIYV
jgi:hypothetical protein